MHVLNNFAFQDEWERAEDGGPPVTFNISQAIDESAANEDYVIDFDLDHLEILNECRPEVEAMREACASGDLTAVQSIFQTHWLNKPVDERIDHNELGASGLCEAIKRNDAVIAGYLLSNVISMQQVHFGMATEYRAYSILQLYVDQKWDINTYLSRMQPPALS